MSYIVDRLLGIIIDEFRRRAVVALINNYKYEELFYYLRKPENRQFADSLLAYLKVTIY